MGRVANLVELVREAEGSVVGARIVDIGSGWRPFIPFVLRLAGARRVITLDVNPWMDKRYAWETYRALRDRLDEVASKLELAEKDVRDAFPHLDSQTMELRAILDAFGVEYRCPADASATTLDGSSIDIVLSSNVLEHVPPSELALIHRESLRILRPGGLAVHRFNPQDHFAEIDSTITGANFLRYSERDWHWLGGSGLSYHNRLRCRQHRQLVVRAGFEVVVDRVRQDGVALQAIRSGELPLHSDFSDFTPEELAADYMWLVARKPDQL
jgi:SAM-dependent methyltransferase